MCNDSTNRDCGCACVGPQGPQGVMGLQGLQGMQGPAGQNGIQGPQGAQGMQGPMGLSGVDGQLGPQGPQGLSGEQGAHGLQGVAGKDCDCSQKKDCCCDAYANLYAIPPQLLGAFGTNTDTVIFQSLNAVTAPDFDMSNIGITGEIKFLKSGVYVIRWGAEAKVEPPIPLPVPSFSFGLWINGLVVGGSVQSGYTQAPGDDTLPISNEVIIAVNAGDVLKLRNASSFSVEMDPNTIGILFPVVVASLCIHCLKDLS